MSIITNRSEILFIYDIRDGNPNGDPLDENKPRIDEETRVNLVTDVRLKRTIRDYLHDFKGQEVFVREIRDEDGYLQDGKTRAKDFLKDEKLQKELENMSFEEQRQIIAKNILDRCIDVRLFGATIPLEIKTKKKKEGQGESGSLTFTGPVQFKMGRSLHRVVMKHIKGTGAFADKYTETSKKRQYTFREEDILPYSLILFYGIINENAARHTRLTDADVSLLLEGIWNGTKSLISRTKAGQTPRLLLKVNYSEENYHIGDLDRMIKLVSEIPDENIRDIEDVRLDITTLINKLKDKRDLIKDVELLVDDRVKFVKDGEDFDIGRLGETTGIPVREIAF
ncbi:MAG TPA: type I-B CRISPR-associated protein Cas7/Csh2 [Candidatus Syntrophoarchaeum butanivorans]|uniref:Type I-B CRISPR-associated protein Cas7/Csh2 n=1 Tax=Candidatus Syntropharchaeum butanivorans TaxID=1839936 RepID=A0A7J2S1D0_9EURY|nr:type I-B CRISPR-associated protein Cas7/Csh2 [Candidatus Syntrophoarchaeum butanivorans]